MYNPKVSIVIPAYNASNFLAEAIDSALAQTYKNIEIIVVNDGSKDNGATERVALSYGDKIRYIFKENGGSSSALNTGIANMTGEWFSWLSHDDLYVPEKIEKQIRVMRMINIDSPMITKHLFFSAYELINENGRTIRKSRANKESRLEKNIQSFSHNGFLIAEPTKYSFHGCSCLIHRNAFDDIGFFDETLRMINDQDMWYRLYSAGYKVHYIPEALVKGRIHSAQVSSSIGFSYHNHEQDMFWNRSLDWLMDKYSNEEMLLYRFAKNAYLKTRYKEGDRALGYAKSNKIKKYLTKLIYQGSAILRQFLKNLYMKFKIKRFYR